MTEARVRRVPRSLALVLPLLVVAAGAGVAQTGAGRSLLASAGLTAKSAPYVELAFSDPAGLPATAATGARVPVRFQARRSAGDAVPVVWTIATARPGRTPRVVQRGTTTAQPALWTLVSSEVPLCTRRTVDEQLRTTVSVGSDTLAFLTRCEGAR